MVHSHLAGALVPIGSRNVRLRYAIDLIGLDAALGLSLDFVLDALTYPPLKTG